MWRAKGGDTLLLYLGPRTLESGVLHGGLIRAGWRAGSVATHPLAAQSTLLEVLSSLEQMDLPDDIGTVRVLVADCWLAVATMPWNSALGKPDQARALASNHLALAGYTLGTADTLRIDDPSFGMPCLTVGFPAALVDALERLAARNAAVLGSVLPLSVAAWRAAHPATGALAVLDGDMAIVARSSGKGAPQELTVRTGVTFTALWQRLCLRDPRLAAAGAVPLLDLEAAGGELPDPFVALALPGDDAVPPVLRLAARQQTRHPLDAIARARFSIVRTALAFACALMAGAALLQAFEAERTLQAVQMATAPVTPAVAPPPVPAWGAAEAARVKAVNVAIRELNQPFSAIVAALQPPPGLQVAVLSMTTVPASSSRQASVVKIVGEAKDSADMARYTAFLGSRRPFSSAYLTEHERDEGAPGRPYRFTLEASWSD